MTDPGLKELAAQVQAQGKQMADLMAAVSGLVRQAQTDGAKKQSTTNAPSWADDEGDERELCWDDGGDGVAGSNAENAGGKGGKGKASAGENDETSGGGDGVAKQEASGGKQGKKKKKRNGGWIEVPGKKPTAARAMEEDGQKKAQEGEKAVGGARKARIELRQEDWGVPVVDHTELAEATVAFAPMAGARKVRREGMPEGSAMVTVAALEGSKRTDVVCRVDGAEKVLPAFVTRSPEGDVVYAPADVKEVDRPPTSTVLICAEMDARWCGAETLAALQEPSGGRVLKAECKRLAGEAEVMLSPHSMFNVRRVHRVYQLMIRVEDEQVEKLLKVSGRRGLFLRIPRWREGSETNEVVWLADPEASLKSALVFAQRNGCLGLARSRARLGVRVEGGKSEQVRESLGEAAAKQGPPALHYLVRGAQARDAASDLEATMKAAGWACRQVAAYWSKTHGDTRVVTSEEPPPHRLIRTGASLMKVDDETEEDRTGRRQKSQVWDARAERTPKVRTYLEAMRRQEEGKTGTSEHPKSAGEKEGVVKQLRAENAELRARNDALRGDIAALSAQMEKLTEMVATMRPKTPPTMPVDRTQASKKKAPKTPVATPTKQKTGQASAPSEDAQMSQAKRLLSTPGKSPSAKAKKAHQPAAAKRS
ncbi:hypothetical protein DIPPA_32444 [Diplonema papillatum]|nr:hypothetical protein DIPPA_32444 [Diplonema papillatum]